MGTDSAAAEAIPRRSSCSGDCDTAARPLGNSDVGLIRKHPFLQKLGSPLPNLSSLHESCQAVGLSGITDQYLNLKGGNAFLLENLDSHQNHRNASNFLIWMHG
jgi:hypothetical protein